jgi:NADPH:quinone reductase
MNLPETNRGIEITQYTGEAASFRIKEKPIPQVKEKDVLIKIHAAPINPSDLMFIRGLYGIKKKLPIYGGFEGSGTVLSVGTAVRWLKPGDRVSCTASAGDGTWAEYLVVPEENCVPLIDSVTLEEGACFFVNPLTASAMIDIVISNGSTCFVQTASASSLGQMLYRYGKRKGLQIINIVRKQAQADILHSLGAEYVLNSSEDNFENNLKRLCKKLNASIALDAVAGELAATVLNSLVYGGKLVSYGALSEETIPVNAGILLFQNKKIEGFWLSSWSYQKGYSEMIQIAKEAQKFLSTDFKTEIQKWFTISDGFQSIEYYKNNMTGGKVMIRP